MAIEPGRLTGQYGTAYCGTTDGGSDIYSGGEIQEWTARGSVDIEDQPALADEWHTRSYTLKSMSISIRKLLGTAVFFDRLATDPVVYLELYCGRGKAATAGTGARLVKGLFIISGADFSNPVGNQVENLTAESTGEVTIGAS